MTTNTATTRTPALEQAQRMRVVAGDIDVPAALAMRGQDAVLILRDGLVSASVVTLLNRLLRDVELPGSVK